MTARQERTWIQRMAAARHLESRLNRVAGA